MKITSNIHTHTSYCDGIASVEEMVQSAITQGLSCIGFSGHSYMSFDESYAMSLEGTRQYMEDVLRARAQYKDQIQVLLGIEWDCYSAWDEYQAAEVPISRAQFDYIIGSVHSLKSPLTGQYYTIDYLPEVFRDCMDEAFGGDVQAMLEAYYGEVTGLFVREKPTVVGHFDLVKKLNQTGVFFDENASWYRKLASDALEQLVQAGAVLEVNTGGIYRGYRTEPYPADFLLHQLREMGGAVLLSGDAHDPKGIKFLFEETVERLKTIGFKEIVQLTEQGLEPVEL